MFIQVALCISFVFNKAMLSIESDAFASRELRALKITNAIMFDVFLNEFLKIDNLSYFNINLSVFMQFIFSLAEFDSSVFECLPRGHLVL